MHQGTPNPFCWGQLYTNDSNMICSLTLLVMPVGSGRQGAPKQQEAASATQARTKKRKGADSNDDESAMKKAKLESEEPVKKKPGRPRKHPLPEDTPATITEVRSKVFLLLHTCLPPALVDQYV